VTAFKQEPEGSAGVNILENGLEVHLLLGEGIEECRKLL